MATYVLGSTAVSVPPDSPAIGGLHPSPPPMELGYSTWQSASAIVGTGFHPPPLPPPPPEPTKIILPDRVQEEVDAEAKDRYLAAVNPFAFAAPSTRPLTDDECVERWGATKAELKDSVAWWEHHRDTLPWWKRKARREARESYANAVARADAASMARVHADGGLSLGDRAYEALPLT